MSFRQSSRMKPLQQVVAAWLFVSLPAVCRPDTGVPTHGLATGVTQMLVGLVVVVALIFASLWLMKKLAAPRGAAAGVLRIVGGMAVGPRERVVLVELGDTWLVLGVAPGRVNMLHQLARLAPQESATAPPPEMGFSTWLKEIVERRDASR
jgi:flagellar protein FliO/FliZ